MKEVALSEIGTANGGGLEVAMRQQVMDVKWPPKRVTLVPWLGKVCYKCGERTKEAFKEVLHYQALDGQTIVRSVRTGRYLCGHCLPRSLPRRLKTSLFTVFADRRQAFLHWAVEYAVLVVAAWTTAPKGGA